MKKGKQLKKDKLCLSLQKIEQIGEKHYKTAMRHVDKFNDLHRKAKEKLNTQPNDPECTFKPALFKPLYTKKNNNNTLNHKKTTKKQLNINKNIARPHQRLLKWGLERDKKNLLKTLTSRISDYKVVVFSSSLETFRKEPLNKSLQNIVDSFMTKSSLEKVNGAEQFYIRKAKAQALKTQKSFYVKGGSYSNLY